MANPSKKSAESKVSAKTKKLPICAAMMICEQVLVGKDEVVSAIRIVDNIILSPTDVPEDGSDNVISNLHLLVVLKKGDAKGDYVFMLNCIGPSGSTVSVGIAEAVFDGIPDTGINIIVHLRLKWDGPGLYWFHLDANGMPLAKTPFRIKVENVTSPVAS